MSRLKFRRAFTLVELLVVISIISLLSSVILASLSESRQKATIASAQIFASNLKQTHDGDALLYLNFDSMQSLDWPNIIANNTGSLPIVDGQINSKSNILVKDTSLHNYGNNLKLAGGNGNTGGTAFAVTVPGIDSKIAYGDFTLALWYKPLDLTNADFTSLIGFNSNANLANLGVCYNGCTHPSQSSGTSLYFRIPGNQQNIFISENIPINRWSYIAMSVKKNTSTATVDVYMNGQNILSRVVDYDNSNIYLVNGSNVQIASSQTGNFNSSLVDDVGVYSSALTASAIQKKFAETRLEHQLTYK